MRYQWHFLLLILFPLSANSQWSYHGLGGVVTNQLVIDSDSIYASTSNGLFCKALTSTDTNWHLVGLSGENVMNTKFITPQKCISQVEIAPSHSVIKISDTRGRGYILGYADAAIHANSWGSHIAKTKHYSDTVYCLDHNIKTFNGGTSWLPLKSTFDLGYYIDVSENNPELVYMGGIHAQIITSYLCKQSLDAGQSWNTMLMSDTFYSKVNTIYNVAVSGSDFYGGGDNVIWYRRSDTFADIVFNPISSAPWAMKYFGISLSPVNNNYVYVSGQGSGATSDKVRLLITSNKGNTWDSVSYLPSIGLSAYAIFSIVVQRKNNDDNIWLGGNGVYTFSKNVPATTGVVQPRVSPTRIYPNPSSDYLSVDADGDVEIVLKDFVGREVYRKFIDKNCQRVDIKKLLPGTYLAELIGDNNITKHKFIKL